ncbi:MAG TPA: class I SAM-dependent methyltransferase [Candidatus Acidoferrales bacterium]|nr:class I SAM-dependent methyltransferase [Candidatus Acidoferrales bacterium]
MVVGSPPLASVAAVAEHYDQLDPFYRRVWGDHLHHGLWLTGRESKDEAVLALCRLVLSKAALEPNASVCDVGCGYGALARIMARECGARVTGFTVSEAQWRYARDRSGGDPRQTFVLADWLENGLPDGSFDCVVAVESSEHFADKGKFCAEAYRVLRPGGRFVVTAWLSRQNPGTMESRCLLRPICTEGRLPSLLSASEYLDLFCRAGFHAPQFEDLSAGVRKTWGVSLRGLAAAILTDPALLARLFERNFRNRVFAVTMVRLWLAYRLGTVRYGIFWQKK